MYLYNYLGDFKLKALSLWLEGCSRTQSIASTVVEYTKVKAVIPAAAVLAETCLLGPQLPPLLRRD
jgi:hypothetical protein